MSEENKLTFPEIGMISSDGLRHFKFEPQPDISAWEVAKLVELYAFMVATKQKCDWEAFVNQFGLEKHFIETDLKEE